MSLSCWACIFIVSKITKELIHLVMITIIPRNKSKGFCNVAMVYLYIIITFMLILLRQYCFFTWAYRPLLRVHLRRTFLDISYLFEIVLMLEFSISFTHLSLKEIENFLLQFWRFRISLIFSNFPFIFLHVQSRVYIHLNKSLTLFISLKY